MEPHPPLQSPQVPIRALDNTLPQSAWHHFAAPNAALRDPRAEACFKEFINTVVNSPSLVVPIPAGIHGGIDDDPFIHLAQELSDVIDHSSQGWDASQDEVSVTTLIQSFLADPYGWAGWLGFQATPNIVGQFTTRVRTWQRDLALSWERLVDHLGTRPADASKELAGALSSLQSLLASDRIARDPYSGAAAALGATFQEYLLAYALNWFARGRVYARRIYPAAAGFHPLRDSAAVTARDQFELDRMEGNSVDWGSCLHSYVTDDPSLRADPGRFITILKNLRAFTATDSRYCHLLERSRDERSPELAQNAIARALTTGARLALPMRDPSATKLLAVRHWLYSELDELKEVGILKKTRLVPLLVKTIRLGLDSPTAHRVDVGIRDYLGMPLWHVYVLPGAPTTALGARLDRPKLPPGEPE
jgi:hypothetical protein